MPDYEAMILEMQETLELLADDCDGDCDKCPYVRYEYRNEYWDDGYPVCTLMEVD